MQVHVTHIFREGNQVAYNLANWSVRCKCYRVFFSSGDLPAHARGAAKLDGNNIPNMR